ncbi:uncharacterized acetyltransferase At3g50280-like [Salvia hispanica]|uniref:uncharacterized acetyltransferase At3g50280-like n=1 Tax=Salvia hispanica TaxID=49212 RepID=UPI0020099B7D|nr:uncharacterized acetyltransferase At3g50280-like [Salvia hispanica]
MPQDQIQTISTSMLQVESTAKITLTPSDLEVLFLEYFQMGLLFPHTTSPTIIHHLKTSLHRTHRFFPTLVGRLNTTKSYSSDVTCFFLDCGHAEGGVLFVHADASALTMADVNESGASLAPALFPLPGIRNKDGASQPLLVVQVTDLGDGLFVGFTLNHLLCDDTAFWYFVNSWAEISREFNLDAPHPQPRSAAELSERVFCLTNGKGAKLKAIVNRNNDENISSLQAVIAHLWRSMIRCPLADLGGTGGGGRPLRATNFLLSGCGRVVKIHVRFLRRAMNSANMAALQIGMSKASRADFGSKYGEMVEVFEEADQQSEMKVVQIEQLAKLVSKALHISLEDLSPTTRFDAIPTNHFILINSPSFDVYGNDFGWGPPVAARSGRGSSFDGRVTVFTGLDWSLEVEVCLLKETLCAMANDVEFMKFVTTIEN